MTHRSLQQTRNLLTLGDDVTEYSITMALAQHARQLSRRKEVQLIYRTPRLGGQNVTGGSRVLAGRTNRGQHRARVFCIGKQQAEHRTVG